VLARCLITIGLESGLKGGYLPIHGQIKIFVNEAIWYNESSFKWKENQKKQLD
jgi:hypothetical protein